MSGTKMISILFYIGCLLIATVVHKTLLVVYESPSPQFLGLLRMLAIILVLGIGRQLQFIQFPSLNWRIVRILLPLPGIYLSLMFTGMINTITLTRPLAAVSRRLVAVMTMVLEGKIVGIQAALSVQYSIMTMMVGAIISAANDIYIYWYGSYIVILVNNMISATNGVYLKKILDSEELNIWGLLYYDACLMIVPDFIVAWASGDFEKNFVLESNWDDLLFWCHLLISSVIDVVLTYSMMLLTKVHSALAVTAMSNLWSIIVTYFMLIILGRTTSFWNVYLGLNISLIGVIFYIYSCVAFKHRDATASHVVKDNLDSSAKEGAKSLNRPLDHQTRA